MRWPIILVSLRLSEELWNVVFYCWLACWMQTVRSSQFGLNFVLAVYPRVWPCVLIGWLLAGDYSVPGEGHDLRVFGSTVGNIWTCVRVPGGLQDRSVPRLLFPRWLPCVLDLYFFVSNCLVWFGWAGQFVRGSPLSLCQRRVDSRFYCDVVQCR